MNGELFRLHARAEETHWWSRARRRIMVRLVRRLAPQGSGVLIVDVGCGTGGNLAALAGEYRCIGIDPASEAVELAQKRFPGVCFLVGEAPDDLPEEARKAAVVLLMDVLEHVADERRLLASLLSSIAPGARLVVTVPAGPGLWGPHDVTLGHHRRYSEAALRAIWRSLPVSIELLSPFNARLYPLIWGVRKFTRARGSAVGESGTDFWMPPAALNSLLERVFAGEADRLLARLESGGAGAYPFGASLLAVLRRVEG
jgi:SAM-dependent methyltransferase